MCSNVCVASLPATHAVRCGTTYRHFKLYHNDRKFSWRLYSCAILLWPITRKHGCGDPDKHMTQETKKKHITGVSNAWLWVIYYICGVTRNIVQQNVQHARCEKLHKLRECVHFISVIEVIKHSILWFFIGCAQLVSTLSAVSTILLFVKGVICPRTYVHDLIFGRLKRA